MDNQAKQQTKSAVDSFKNRRQLTDEQIRAHAKRNQYLGSEQSKFFMVSPEMREKFKAVIEQASRRPHS